MVFAYSASTVRTFQLAAGRRCSVLLRHAVQLLLAVGSFSEPNVLIRPTNLKCMRAGQLLAERERRASCRDGRYDNRVAADAAGWHPPAPFDARILPLVAMGCMTG
jgi:hypothetical protein